MLQQIKSQISGCTFLSFSKTKYYNAKEEQWLEADGILAKINGKKIELVLPKKIRELTDRDLDKIKEHLENAS